MDSGRAPHCRSRWPASIVFSSYLVVFALFTAPWFLAASHAVPVANTRSGDDTRNLTWVMWWVAGALEHGLGGVFDTPINYPARNQLTGSEHFGALQLLYFPLLRVTGNPFLAMKLLLFLSYPLAALAMNVLLAALGFSPLIAWVIGLSSALGPLQAPASIYMLHSLAVFPPATAWSLHRLRESNDVKHSAMFAAIFLTGAFAAYYTVAILLIVIAIWGTAELLRFRHGRARFAATVAGVVLIGLVLLGVASLRYLTRSEIGDPTGAVQRLSQDLKHAWGVWILLAPRERLGGVALVLGVAGCAGLFHPRFRRLALLALALLVASAFLVSGAPQTLAEMLPASPITPLLTLPVRFFRIVTRFTAVGALGLAVLGAIALELVRRRFGRRVTFAVASIVTLAVALERGGMLWRQGLEASDAYATEAPIYREVGTLTAQRRGPLLEVPMRSFGRSLQPEAMIGNIWHGLPLLTGHTGYTPPQRHVVDSVVGRLPSEEAVQDLVDLTHLRWILVRPARFWGTPERRGKFLRGLRAVPGVGPEWTLDGWNLLQVQREVRHASWYDAMVAGPRAGRTLLGAALQPLDPTRTASSLELLEALPALAPTGAPLKVRVRLHNRGSDPWPGAVGTQTLIPLELVLQARWQTDDAAPRAAEDAATVRLGRDVPTGESIDLDLTLRTPTVPGSYQLALSLAQRDAAALDGDLNRPLVVPLETRSRNGSSVAEPAP